MNEIRINPYRMWDGCFIPNWLVETTAVSAGAKLLYSRMCKYSGKDGKCYPSIETLAVNIGTPKRSCERYMTELLKNKLVCRDRRGHGKTNIYYFIYNQDLMPMAKESHFSVTNIHIPSSANMAEHEPPKLVVPTANMADAISLNDSLNDSKDIYVGIIDSVIKDLNAVVGTNYKTTSKATRDLVRALLKDGFSLDDFKAVHRKKYDEWGRAPSNGEDMSKYLRPSTLYRKSKFEEYLNQVDNAPVRDEFVEKILGRPAQYN